MCNCEYGEITEEHIKEIQANARLIASAPEMYELLKVWTEIQAQPTLRTAQETARKLLARIDRDDDSEELRPCPFCGSGKVGTVINFPRVPAGVHAVCGECGATTGCRPTMEEAIASWNKRATRNSYKFFQNTDCEYFPCHKTADTENFSCLFCYCPLYRMADCPGTPETLANGIKDCTNCTLPHTDYEAIIEVLKT